MQNGYLVCPTTALPSSCCFRSAAQQALAQRIWWSNTHTSYCCADVLERAPAAADSRPPAGVVVACISVKDQAGYPAGFDGWCLNTQTQQENHPAGRKVPNPPSQIMQLTQMKMLWSEPASTGQAGHARCHCTSAYSRLSALQNGWPKLFGEASRRQEAQQPTHAALCNKSAQQRCNCPSSFPHGSRGAHCLLSPIQYITLLMTPTCFQRQCDARLLVVELFLCLQKPSAISTGWKCSRRRGDAPGYDSC